MASGLAWKPLGFSRGMTRCFSMAVDSEKVGFIGGSCGEHPFTLDSADVVSHMLPSYS